LISWKLPFDHKKTDQSVILAITNGELPSKPEEIGEPEVFAALWNLCGLCWLGNSSRPSASESLEILSGVLLDLGEVVHVPSTTNKAKNGQGCHPPVASSKSNSSRSPDGLGRSWTKITCSICNSVEWFYETDDDVQIKNLLGWKCQECSELVRHQLHTAVPRHGHESKATGDGLDREEFRGASWLASWARTVDGGDLEERQLLELDNHGRRAPNNIWRVGQQIGYSDPSRFTSASQPMPSGSNEYSFHNTQTYQAGSQWQGQSSSNDMLPHGQPPDAYVHFRPTDDLTSSSAGQASSSDFYARAQVSATGPTMPLDLSFDSTSSFLPAPGPPDSYVLMSHGPTDGPTSRSTGQVGGPDFDTQAQVSATAPSTSSGGPSTSSNNLSLGPPLESSSVVCHCGFPYSGGAEGLIWCHTCKRSFHKVCCHIPTSCSEWRCWDCWPLLA